MYTAGIDVGTTSICILIREKISGDAVKVVSCPNDAAIQAAHSWEQLQDPERIIASVEELIAACAAYWPQVEGIGISCQMHGILYVDERGKHASPLYTWQDGRGDQQLETGLSYAGRLRERTGYPVSTGYGLVTHFYNVRSKMVPAQARRLCTIGDYLAMRLCGSSAPVMDASNAASLGLFDLRNREFDRDAVNKTGIDPSILPMLAGNDNPLVGRTGDGKPVFCAIGDNQASFIGAVAKAEDSLLVNVGTGSQISVYSNTYENIAGLDTRPFPGGGYLLVGASLSGGKSYELLERFFREICHAFTGLEMSDSALFEAMNRLAAASLEADEALPLVGTQFYGTRHKPDAAGTITGLNALNMRPGAIIAGFLQGMTEELLAFARLLPASRLEAVSCLVGSGNGIRRNPALQRLLQVKLGRPLLLSGVEEEAACGAAVHAANGLMRLKADDADS